MVFDLQERFGPFFSGPGSWVKLVKTGREISKNASENSKKLANLELKPPQSAHLNTINETPFVEPKHRAKLAEITIPNTCIFSEFSWGGIPLLFFTIIWGAHFPRICPRAVGELTWISRRITTFSAGWLVIPKGGEWNVREIFYPKNGRKIQI